MTEDGHFTDEEDFFLSVANTLRNPLLILDRDFRVLFANRRFLEVFRVSPEDTVNRRLWELGTGQWRIPTLERLLHEVLPAQRAIEDFEVESDFPVLGRKIMKINARKTSGPPPVVTSRLTGPGLVPAIGTPGV
jgi:PAS domain-containing protein